jgi:hypothetical protein
MCHPLKRFQAISVTCHPQQSGKGIFELMIHSFFSKLLLFLNIFLKWYIFSLFIFQVRKKQSKILYKVRVEEGSCKVKWTSKRYCDRVKALVVEW